MMIEKGIGEKQIEELINYANNDEEVKKFTSDAKRFKDRECFNEWLKKERKIYTLVDEGGHLMGISWFGELEGFTLALRIYGETRGKKYSEWFLRVTMNDFMKSEEYQKAENKNWWVETSKDNIAAIKTYQKLGFEESEEGRSPEKTIFRRRHDFESERK